MERPNISMCNSSVKKYVAWLEMQLKERTAEVQQLIHPVATRVLLDPYAKNVGNPLHYVADNTLTHYYMPNPRSGTLNISDGWHLGVQLDAERNYITVRGSEHIVVCPRAANVVEIRLDDKT